MKKAMILMVLVLSIPACAGVSWINVVGGSNVTTSGGVLTWGTYPQSGLAFTENALQPGVFQLGTLTHTNRVISIGSSAKAATLNLELLGETWLCPMTINETLNLCPWSDDRVGWSVPDWSHDGLTILGFGTSQYTLVDHIWTPEGRWRSIPLWASYCPPMPSIPAPGALVLACLGAALVRIRKAWCL